MAYRMAGRLSEMSAAARSAYCRAVTVRGRREQIQVVRAWEYVIERNVGAVPTTPHAHAIGELETGEWSVLATIDGLVAYFVRSTRDELLRDLDEDARLSLREDF